MHAPKLGAVAALALTWSFAGLGNAQTPPPVSPDGVPVEQDPIASFQWQTEGTGLLADRAEIDVPPGYRFLDGGEASRLVEALGNISSKEELGLLSSDDFDWFVVFFFDDIGYVKDDDKNELDADALASQMREGLEQTNEIRKERGIPALYFDGWAIEPRYNEANNQLEWASRLRSDGGVSVNYNTRVLGRKGVMRVILVTDPELLQGVLPEYQGVMSGFRFVEGEKYSQYVSGDKIAKYGLAALVAGGAAAVAAKTGLLAALFLFLKKGGKLLVLGVGAVGAWIASLFRRKSD